MSYVGKVTAGGSTCPVASTIYGTCGTAANVAAKAVTCTDFDHLITGVTVYIKFTNSNTAANATLNVNSTGAKPFCRYGTTRVGTTEASSWKAGAVISATYDGTNWMLDDFNPVHQSMTADELDAGTETSARVISPKVLVDYVSPIASDASSAASTASSAHSIATSTQNAVSALSPRVDALENDAYDLATLSGYGTNYFYAKRSCATLMCTGTSKTGAWTATTLCTIPDGYRPPTDLPFLCQKDGAYSQSDTYVVVGANGTVTLQNAGGTQNTNVYRVTCTWAY